MNTEVAIAVVNTLFSPDALRCGDSIGEYASFSNVQCMTHQVVGNDQGGARAVGAYRTEYANGYYRRLKEWMERVHGVATHYPKNAPGCWSVMGRVGGAPRVFA